MDNRDTCSLKDKKKMDANTVWQWHIMYVKKYSRHPEPFQYSSKIGLDFNVASNRQKKLDLQLVTNAVILEVCDFAKTVNKSKRHFITNILENNFDLGLENEQQRIDFTARILHKVQDLIRKPPKDKHEVFTLFDTSSEPECNTNSNNGLNMASTEHMTESFLVEMDDTEDSEFKSSQATSKENIKTGSLSEEMDRAHVDDSEHEDELKCSAAQSTEELKEDVLPPSFPHCEEINLNLDIGSKQSLDPGLLTKGVMLELVHFTKVLTASYSPIVLGVLEHNFELDLKSQRVKNQVWFKISHLLKRRKRLLTTGSKITPEFKNEPFSFQTNPFKRPQGPALSNIGAPQSYLKNEQENTALLTTSEQVTKRRRIGQSKHMETDTLSHYTDLCTSGTAEGDYCYTCPLGESDLDSDEVTDSENTGNQDHLQNPTTSDILTESSCLGICASFLTSTDISSSLPTVNSYVNLPFASQPDKRGLCGGEEQTQMPRNVTKECDMEQEEMGTENNYTCPLGESDLVSDKVTDSENVGNQDHLQNPTSSDMEQEEMGTENNMWKLRANRVKQILCAPNKEFGAFYRSRKLGLEFNVGFGPKQNISVDSLTNSILLEVAKFALAINSSQQDFIMEILEYNFDFGLQSEHHRNIFTCEIMNRVRQLKNCEDADKFSNEVFELPGPVPLIHMANQSMGSVNPELSSISRMEECDVAPVCPPDSHAETKEHILRKSVDLYPFCKEIGLRLHVNNRQPNKKLDINKLTNGAMTEVTNFAEKLCGTFEQICLDILRHNFDLDLPSGDSDLASNILERIPAVMEQKNLSTYVKAYKKLKGTRKDSSKMAKLGCQNNQNLDACSTGSSQAAIIDQNVGSSPDIEHQNELNLKLWKLRANHIQRILSIPHEEHCPLYFYSRCKTLGIDFNVGSGVKQNLDPKLLTNGIMVELNTFATALQSATKHFVIEILEYNFNLNLNNELNRSAFAEQTMSKIRVNLRKKNSIPRMKMPFELPDMKCIQEFTYAKTTYCPKCYQDRNHKLCQDESDPGRKHHPRPHTMTDTVSADANCTAQKPAKDASSTFSTTEETIMDSYPRCKKIGLNLCVDKDQPKHKLDMHILTCGIMNEVANFAKKLCGTKNKIINDILEHNFSIGMQSRDINPAQLFTRIMGLNDGGPAWFNKVFVIQPFPHRDPGDVTTKRRKLALQTMKGRATLRSHNISVVKSKKNQCSRGNLFASFLTSTDVSSSLPTVNSNVNPPFASQPDNRGLRGGEEQTPMPRNVAKECDMEQEEMGTENNYTCPLGESDLDSDEVTDSENAGNQDHLQNPTSSDMEQEAMGTENNMWKLRANRVKQILYVLNKELGPFNWSQKLGLEFNVGFGPKQNISVDSLTNSVLLEVAKFALAINSSEQDFIMEILGYNFDFGLQSEHHRNISTCEIMNRVRQLKNCEDAIKFSNEVFELPGHMPLTHMANQSMSCVNPELSSISRMEECDVAPVCPPDSHAETEEHISRKSVDLYPFCKEMGLRLHVNNRQPNKKLEINKLTNGAMTEVTNFAEKLCGTFEQICLDILRHNFDLDLQSGDSDLARNILERIPAIMEQKNLSTCVKAYKKLKGTRKDSSKMVKLDCQNNQNVDACSAGSSQAAIIDQNLGGSTDIEHQNELNLKLWKLRANHIQRILSIPHEEHCPLYFYSRCKTLGIDFNLGPGVKQNLDPKLLTNGIMVELNTFATALQSATKHFITEILEYNFNLDLKNELNRNAFAQQTMIKIRAMRAHKRSSVLRKKMLFELPDMECIQEPTYDKTTYCPKCYQDRNHKLRQDESDPGHMHHPRPHTMTDTVSADANCTAQKPEKDPSSTFSTTEETIMDSYPHCKEIGLNLCVDKDQPKDKLDTHVLTRGIMNEVANFAKKLCGTKSKIIHAVLEHNFRIGMQSLDANPAQLFRKATALNDGRLAWFSEVFVIQPASHRQPGPASKLKEAFAMQGRERKETFKKRKLALQTKEERVTLPSPNISHIKSKTNQRSRVNCYPICTEIGLDLDVTSKSGEKEKLDLKLLTRAVVLEIHKFATNKVGQYFPGILYDILDYNFDLSSQHYRHWEFSIATASKVQTMVKVYRKKRDGADNVFKLPFVFPKASQRCVEKRQNKKRKKKTNEDSFVHQVRHHSDVNHINFLDVVKTKEEPWFHDKDTNSPTDPWTIMQMNGSSVSVGCGSPLQGNMQIKEEEYDPHYGNMKPEPDTEEKYHPHYDDVKTESNAEDVEYLVPGEPAGSLGYTLITMCPNSESNIKTESENEDVQYYFQTEPQEPRYDDVKTESNAEDVEYLVPVEAAGSQGYSMVTIGQSNESTFIKEEQENVPADSYHYGVASYSHT